MISKTSIEALGLPRQGDTGAVQALWWGKTQRWVALSLAGNGPVGSSVYTHGNLAIGLQGWQHRWEMKDEDPHSSPLLWFKPQRSREGFAAVQTNFGRVSVPSPHLPRYIQHPYWPPTYDTCLGKLLRLSWMWKGVCKAIGFIFIYFLNSAKQDYLENDCTPFRHGSRKGSPQIWFDLQSSRSTPWLRISFIGCFFFFRSGSLLQIHTT